MASGTGAVKGKGKVDGGRGDPWTALKDQTIHLPSAKGPHETWLSWLTDNGRRMGASGSSWSSTDLVHALREAGTSRLNHRLRMVVLTRVMKLLQCAVAATGLHGTEDEKAMGIPYSPEQWTDVGCACASSLCTVALHPDTPIDAVVDAVLSMLDQGLACASGSPVTHEETVGETRMAARRRQASGRVLAALLGTLCDVLGSLDSTDGGWTEKASAWIRAVALLSARHPTALVRRAAAHLLPFTVERSAGRGLTLPPASLQGIDALLADSHAPVREAAFSSLVLLQRAGVGLEGWLYHAAAKAALVEREPRAGVRAMALEVLRLLTQHAPDFVVGFSRGGDNERVRLTDAVFETMSLACTDLDVGVRAAACAHLGALVGVDEDRLLQAFEKRPLRGSKHALQAQEQRKEASGVVSLWVAMGDMEVVPELEEPSEEEEEEDDDDDRDDDDEKGGTMDVEVESDGNLANVALEEDGELEIKGGDEDTARADATVLAATSTTSSSSYKRSRKKRLSSRRPQDEPSRPTQRRRRNKPPARAAAGLAWYGALVHGWEDEFSVVRMAALRASCEMGMRSRAFGDKAMPFLVELFNDDSDAVRCESLLCVSQLGQGSVFRPGYLKQLLTALEDTSADVRRAGYRVVQNVRMPDAKGLMQTVRILKGNVKAYAGDIDAVLSVCSRLGSHHPSLVEASVHELLGHERVFLVPEPRVESPAYIAALLLVYQAVQASEKGRAQWADLLPAFFDRHVEYGKQKHGGAFGPPVDIQASVGAAAAAPSHSRVVLDSLDHAFSLLPSLNASRSSPVLDADWSLLGTVREIHAQCTALEHVAGAFEDTVSLHKHYVFCVMMCWRMHLSNQHPDPRQQSHRSAQALQRCVVKVLATYDGLLAPVRVHFMRLLALASRALRPRTQGEHAGLAQWTGQYALDHGLELTAVERDAMGLGQGPRVVDGLMLPVRPLCSSKVVCARAVLESPEGNSAADPIRVREGPTPLSISVTAVVAQGVLRRDSLRVCMTLAVGESPSTMRTKGLFVCKPPASKLVPAGRGYLKLRGVTVELSREHTHGTQTAPPSRGSGRKAKAARPRQLYWSLDVALASSFRLPGRPARSQLVALGRSVRVWFRN